MIEDALDEYALDNPAIERKVDIAMTGSVTEFALAFSQATGLNLAVDPQLNQTVTANFTDTRPRDILSYLVRFYDLDLVLNGTILSLVPYELQEVEAPEKVLGVVYNDYRQVLTLDLDRDTLADVVREIAQATGKNIVLTPDASRVVASGFIGAANLESALEQLAVRNGLELIRSENDAYYLLDYPLGRSPGDLAAPTEPDPTQQAPNTNGRRALRSSTIPRTRSGTTIGGSRRRATSTLSVTLEKDTLRGQIYNVEARGASLVDLLDALTEENGLNYYLTDDPVAEVDLMLEGANLGDVLRRALVSNGFTYTMQDGFLMVGAPETGSMRQTKVMQLKHRSVKELVAALPPELLTELGVLEFIELNSLILDGAPDKIEKVEAIVNELDRSVPMITIELLIVDVQKNAEVRTGVEIGIGEEPVKAGGTVFPEIDLTLSSRGLNDIIDLLAGNGIVNLGRVNPNFYARLQAAENNGYVKVHSKPRLSTINGQTANFSLGETRYYEVQRTTLQGVNNPISLQARDFQSVNADFTVEILPVVSGDGGVTLDITVDQNDFIGQITNDAPPAQVRRSFNSTIRVNDEEMVVLGGLTSNQVDDGGRGVPFLSRVPVIKYLFSSRRRAKRDSRLLIFVRPKVTY